MEAPKGDAVLGCLIVDGGISGSALAHNLNKSGANIILAEACDYLDGNAKSKHNKEGFIWEDVPNSFVT
eukprot:12005870-Ditylum_brightwellii.AAC.1